MLLLFLLKFFKNKARKAKAIQIFCCLSHITICFQSNALYRRTPPHFKNFHEIRKNFFEVNRKTPPADPQAGLILLLAVPERHGFLNYSGFIVGKRMMSRMLGASVMSMITRSMPTPRPPVGGSPTSRALTKSRSIG